MAKLRPTSAPGQFTRRLPRRYVVDKILAERNGGKEYQVSWKVRRRPGRTLTRQGYDDVTARGRLSLAELIGVVGASRQPSGDGGARRLDRQEEEIVQVARAPTSQRRGVDRTRGQAGEAAAGRGVGVVGPCRIGRQLRRVRGRRPEQARADAQIGAGHHRRGGGRFAASSCGD